MNFIIALFSAALVGAGLPTLLWWSNELKKPEDVRKPEAYYLTPIMVFPVTTVLLGAMGFLYLLIKGLCTLVGFGDVFTI